MTGKISRFIIYVTASIFMMVACNTKKQVARNRKATSALLTPIVPKKADSFQISVRNSPPQYLSLPKRITRADNYEVAFLELKDMLEGRRTPDFERAVFLSESPFYNNTLSYRDFQAVIDFHLFFIQSLIAVNDKSDSIDFNTTVQENGRFRLEDIRFLPNEKKRLYQNTLSNWAIFTYLTDTTYFYPFRHLPYSYATEDPFGIKDWTNSQVIGMLLSKDQKGNCFALTGLYKILADRLESGARICTAPQHSYIQHKDTKGDYYNVELATAGHPTSGTIQTLTYTTSQAIKTGIALRSYDEKQSIGLCLINLAKGYEHTFGSKGHEFLLRCADLVLKYDSLNLNALLLKHQVLDIRVSDYAARNGIGELGILKNDAHISGTLAALEQHTALLYRLGYRQMPLDMQKIIMTGIYPKNYKDKNPSPFTTIDPKDGHRKSFQTTYGGLFQEVFEKKPVETYAHFSFSTETNTLFGIDTSAQNAMLIDPVAFAYDFGARMYDPRLGRWLSVDPYEKKYPNYSPYIFAANNPLVIVDIDGRDIIISERTRNSVYGEVILKMAQNSAKLGAASEVFGQYLKKENTLNLSMFYFAGQTVKGQKAGMLSSAHTNVEGYSGKDADINFNSQRARDFNADEGTEYTYKDKSEIGAAGVILHEMLLHANTREGTHDISMELFNSLVSGLQAYSLNVMGKELSMQDAIAVSLQGLGENSRKLYEQLKTQHNLTMTYEEALQRGKDLSYEGSNDHSKGEVNSDTEDNTPRTVINEESNE